MQSRRKKLPKLESPKERSPSNQPYLSSVNSQDGKKASNTAFGWNQNSKPQDIKLTSFSDLKSANIGKMTSETPHMLASSTDLRTDQEVLAFSSDKGTRN